MKMERKKGYIEDGIYQDKFEKKLIILMERSTEDVQSGIKVKIHLKIEYIKMVSQLKLQIGLESLKIEIVFYTTKNQNLNSQVYI